MRKSFGLGSILFLYTLLIIAAPTNNWWQKANDFYQLKQYDSAASYYEKLAAQKPKNAVLYYNLGNTYYKLNQVGEAVLNYERALHLKPGYKEAEDNLILAQSRIPNRIQGGEDIFFVRWWQWLTQVNFGTCWAVISLLAFLGLLGLMLSGRLGWIQVSYRRQVNITLGIVLLISLLLAYSSALRQESHEAVVMQQDAPLTSGRGGNKPQSLVPEGTTVKIEHEQEGWTEVRLPDGRKGWMQLSYLARI
jgi:tetratricopeptide (TPR) repeat protein